MQSKRYHQPAFLNIRRWLFSTKKEPTSSTVSALRSSLASFIEERRKQSQKHDIRLEPYLSKGVYTESGAIRPMPKRYPLGIVKILLIALPFLYLGSMVSKYAAIGLENMDVFIYSDDDDDDDD